MKFADLSLRKIALSLVAVGVWWLFWLPTQALFIVDDIPIVDQLFQDMSAQDSFTVLTLWIVAVHVVAMVVWYLVTRDFSFLIPRKKWHVFAYVLPLVLAVALLATKSTIFGVATSVYVVVMMITIFFQDMLTTGYLQTALSRTIGGVLAAVVTVIIFFLGHFIPIGEIVQPMSLVMIAGFVLFSWLRYKTGSIYLTNVVHLTYALVMVF